MKKHQRHSFFSTVGNDGIIIWRSTEFYKVRERQLPWVTLTCKNLTVIISKSYILYLPDLADLLITKKWNVWFLQDPLWEFFAIVFRPSWMPYQTSLCSRTVLLWGNRPSGQWTCASSRQPDPRPPAAHQRPPAAGSHVTRAPPPRVAEAETIKSELDGTTTEDLWLILLCYMDIGLHGVVWDSPSLSGCLIRGS